MKRLIKFGLGVVTGALVASAIYQGYQELSDQLRDDLVEAVREHFSDLPILTLWLFDDPEQGTIFKGGVIIGQEDSDLQNIAFEINAENLEVLELERTKIEMES